MGSMTIAPARKSLRRRLVELLPGRLRYAVIAAGVYRKKNGRWPNVVAPKEVREKLQQRKILDTDPRMPRLADKVLVKKYVAERLGNDWVIPTLWHGTELPPIAERNWALPYVIKVNSGCGWNLFIRDEKDLDWPVIEAKCRDWMGTSFAVNRGEWLYDHIQPQILVEPFIALDADMPVDYKFWTFHGRVAFCNVVTGRGDKGFYFTMFDRDWRRIKADMGFPNDPSDVAPPKSFAAMVQAAEKLAADLPFVRVDFYEVDGQPLLGEMTFYPGAGLDPVNPAGFNDYVLSLWQKSTPVPAAMMQPGRHTWPSLR